MSFPQSARRTPVTVRLIFPDGFLWGAAASGPQTEGFYEKPHQSIMDHWYHECPDDFFSRVGPDVTCDFFHHYREDFALMKEMGFNSYRTSIQWTRLIADLETGEPDSEGAAFYRDVIRAAKENDIELILNLHHFDLPQELLEQYGGWTSRHVVDLYVKYAETAFSLFGNDVSRWVTFNEPMVIAEAGYLYGFHWPKYHNHGKDAVQVIYHLNLASALAVREYRAMNLPGTIGIILNLTPAYPRSDSPEDLAASAFAEDFCNRFFLMPAVHGVFPEHLIQTLKQDNVLFTANPGDAEILMENTVDFLGLNYYHPRRVKARETALNTDEWMPDRYFEDYEMPGRRINPYRGWEIFPQAVYDIAMAVKTEYRNIPWYLSENGMGVEAEERFAETDGSIRDDYRIEFYKEHLSMLHRAIQEGSACFGFHAWTATDCWSWNNAFKNRYGFAALDLSTQKRTIKKSGTWFRTVSEHNGFDIDE